MKADRYLLFECVADAQRFVDRLDEERKSLDRWAHPNINPFDGRAVIPWNDEYLAAHAHLTDGVPDISLDAAQEEGWAFGHFSGLFAKARAKLEEAQLIRDGLDQFDKHPNYPAYHALFFGFLSATYAIKESVRKVCSRISPDAKLWWNTRFNELRSDQLLSFFYDLNNSDKHSIATPLLRPRTKFYGYKGAALAGLVFSSEGIFVVTNRDTPQERRVFFEGAEAEFEVYLDLKELIHKGKDVSALSLKQQLDFVLEFYEELVYEARCTFDK